MKKILIENNFDLVAIHETYTEDKTQLDSRGQILGYVLLGATYEEHYCVATYVRSDIKNAFLLTITNKDNINVVVTKSGEDTSTNPSYSFQILGDAFISKP